MINKRAIRRRIRYPRGMNEVTIGIKERRLLIGLHLASRRVASEIEAALAPYGMRLRAFMVLGMLDEFGELSQQAIGARLGVDRTTMVGIVDELEQRGLVERNRRPEDRRQYALRITDTGKALRTQMEDAADEAEERLLAGLPRTTKVALRRALAHLMAEAAP
jgi:MarR family transcriptional regulator, lower aerobic nicotinate degradation pathway regulator